MSKIKVSVVIPCYNEKENLKRGVLKEVYDYLKKQDYSWEVLISDDGSSDGSFDIVEKQINDFKGFKHLKNPHGGKPSALRYGLEKAKGKYVLFTDMDQSTPIKELRKLLPFMEKGFQVAIGSRGFSRKNYPLYRQLGGAAFLLLRRTLILPELRDTQCGFKLFETRLVREAFPKLEFFRVKQRTAGWKVTSYDVELLHILKKMGANIAETIVQWKDEDVSTNKGGGLSKYVRESTEMLGQIARVKINELKGQYN